ncbi:MAG: CoA transferase [Chloroflexi bacterium]|nr:CoA transferase [Chloroflexota bacterium]
MHSLSSPATLAGLKVVELSEFIAGPYCGMLLAGLGADVVKVENPNAGDETRRYGPFPGDIPDPETSGLFTYLNRGKRGITLDIKVKTGRKLLLELIERADVLIESMPPAVAADLQLDYPSLHKVNSNLVVTSITPFGQTGPYRDFKGYAINCSALGGMSLTMGEPGREPLAPPLSMGHYQAGIVGGIGTMFALLARPKIGRGQQVDAAETDAWAISHTGNVVSSFVYHGSKRIRAGHRTPGPYPMTILPCKDGYVYLVALQGAQWKRFLDIVGDGKIPDWYASDPRFADRRIAGNQYADELDALLAPWLMSHTKAEIFALCRQSHVPFAPVRDMAEVTDDLHLNERQYFAELDMKRGGGYKCPGPPFRFSRTSWSLGRTAPHLGEHNEDVYVGELGYSREILLKLRRSNII